ncbi:MAG: hypothetical protein RL358_755 [Pseudomonadota bacterium]|jgi:hypothetical protein
MLIVRIFLIAVALMLVLNIALYLLTRNPRYYRLAWQIARFSAVLLAVFALLYVLERYVLVASRVLL